MMRLLFFLRVFKSLVVSSAAWFCLLAVSLSLSSALIFSLFSLPSGAREKLDHELRAYGANVVVRPKGAHQTVGFGQRIYGEVYEENFIREDMMKNLLKEYKNDIENAEFYLFQRMKWEKGDADIVGMHFLNTSALETGWRISGRAPEKENELLMGEKLAEAFSIKTGTRMRLVHRGKPLSFFVTGILETGGYEEENAYVNMKTLQKQPGLKGKINLCFLRVKTTRQSLDAVVERMRFFSNQLEIVPLKQIQNASDSLLRKVTLLILFAALYVTLCIVLSISSALEMFVHRMEKDIALLYALGGRQHFVSRLLALNAVALGALSGGIGIGIGTLFSQTVSRTVFGSALNIHPSWYAVSFFSGLVVSLVSLLMSLRKTIRVSPARVLRGE